MKLSLTRELSEIQRIVEARRAFFAERGLPATLAYAVDLATEELFVNMIRHNSVTTEAITLELEAVQDGVVISLTDHNAEPFDPRDVAPVDCTLPLEERRTGGLGLHLVRSLVGAVHYTYQNRCSTVSFVAKVEPQHV